MRKTESDVKNTLTQYQEDFLMYGKYNVESLNKMIDTLNLLHDKQTELEKLVTTKMHERNMSSNTKRFIKLGKNYWMQ